MLAVRVPGEPPVATGSPVGAADVVCGAVPVALDLPLDEQSPSATLRP